MDWASRIAELMWGAGLAAIPLAIVASVCCRIKSFRPATRHAMWFAVLFTLLSPVLMAGVWRPAWFRSDRVMSVVNSLTPEVAARQEPVDTAAIVTDERPIEEAAPHQMDASLLSLVKDATPLGVTSSHAALSKEEFVGPLPAMVELPSVKSHPVATKPALVGLEKALLTPAPKPEPIAAVDRPARTAPVPVIKTSNATREWVTQLLAARDALAAVPSIPPVVWLVGASLLVSFWVARYVLIRRLIARADPAPASMVALVKRLAQVAGVKRVPETLVVDDRVSPMIWCGLRPRLIIPRALWSELDTKCQCAVIVHELCHLRRRDHRMCWVESLIGLAYWWHPVSWWARRRLRDEAESCCDAWVTTLLPGGRRAYAEALVATKSFLSVPGRSGAPGLGVSGRTRQLARRVTMVMTQRVAPRASVCGLAFAIAIAATGMFVMPGLACPPEEAKAKEEAAKVRAAAMRDKQAEQSARKAKDEAQAKEGVLFLGEAPALEAMRRAEGVQLKQKAGSDNLQEKVKVLKDKERALQDMEKRLREMEAKLEQLQQQGQRGPRGANNLLEQPRVVAGMAVAPRAAQPPQPPQPARVANGLAGRLSAPRGGLAQGPGTTVMTLPRGAVAVGGTPLARVPGVEIVTTDGETTARSYALPEGKLEALTDLMIRDDVPILVSRDNGKITIHATPRQHEIIGAFIQMINPEGHSARSGSTNPLAAATLYQRSSQQYAEELKAAAKALEAQKKDSQRQHQQLRRQLERTREQAQKMREQHEAARHQHEEDGVDESNDPFVVELDGMESRLEQLDGLSERIDQQIEELECTIECLKEQAEEQVDCPDPVIAPEQSETPEAAVPAATPSPFAAARAYSGRPGTAAAPAAPAAPATPAAGAAPAAPATPTAPAAPAIPATPTPTSSASATR